MYAGWMGDASFLSRASPTASPHPHRRLLTVMQFRLTTLDHITRYALYEALYGGSQLRRINTTSVTTSPILCTAQPLPEIPELATP